MRLEGPAALAFCAPSPALCRPGASPYFQVTYAANGLPARIDLTSAGASLARDLDRQTALRHGFRFVDPTDDWMVYGKLRVSNLTLGVEVWQVREGSGADSSVQSVIPASTWAPQETALYAKYSRDLAAGLTFNALARYLQTGVRRGDSKILFFESYSGALTTTRSTTGASPDTDSGLFSPPGSPPSTRWAAESSRRSIPRRSRIRPISRSSAPFHSNRITRAAGCVRKG
jgi:hypothetical protein